MLWENYCYSIQVMSTRRSAKGPRKIYYHLFRGDFSAALLEVVLFWQSERGFWTVLDIADVKWNICLGCALG